MKSLYYRSQKISSRSLVVLALVSLASVAVLELFPLTNSSEQRELMLDAARRAQAAFDVIKQRRVAAGHEMLESQDPAATGMLGPSMSLVTTLPGHLDAKQTSTNPDFAAVAVHYLLQAGARPGDEVAIGCTGSFPAMNISVLSAAEAMGLRPTLVSSAASSQFGANHPDLMWPDMERLLAERGLLETRSLAVSRGGFRDKADGMTDDTRELLDQAIRRSGLPMLDCTSLEDSIARRIDMYGGPSDDLARFVAYINVGGGSASVGGTRGNEQLGRGLITPRQFRRIDDPIDSVAARFLAADVPFINMIHIVAAAEEHGLPVAPQVRTEPGDGGVYASSRYRRSFALGGIIFILTCTSFIVRPPLWATEGLAKRGWPSSQASDAHWMV